MSDTIGLVTVLFNSRPVLEGFFASVAATQGVSMHLIVVCNDQDAESAEMCRQFGRDHGIETTVIENDANLGVAEANNQGLQICLDRGYRHALILNNDIEFGADVIAGCRDALGADYQAVSPLITYFDRPDRIWYGGGSINTLLARTEHYDDGRPVRPEDQTLRQTGYAPTCFMMVDCAVFHSIGLMDERYFVYYDDSDFVLRMTRAGFRLGYAPAHQVLHKVSSSTGGGSSPFTLHQTNRNRIFFIRKNIRLPVRWLSLAYVCLTKLVRLPLQSARDRKIILRAVQEGFAMPLSNEKA